MEAFDDDREFSFDDEVHFVTEVSFLGDVNVGDEEFGAEFLDEFLDVGGGDRLEDWHFGESWKILNDKKFLLKTKSYVLDMFLSVYKRTVTNP